MLFFVFNAVEGQLISTGAFEVSLNGKAEIYVVPPPHLRMSSGTQSNFLSRFTR